MDFKNEDDFTQFVINSVSKMMDSNIYHAYTSNEIEFYVFGAIDTWSGIYNKSVHIGDLTDRVMASIKEHNSLVEEI